MTNFIRIPLALDLALSAFEKLSPGTTAGVLPLGGSPFVQLAVLVLFGIAAQELFSKPNKK
jgi:hypothetical protein